MTENRLYNTCKECGNEYKLLHWAHLRKHGYQNQTEYRERYKIRNTIPMCDEAHSEHSKLNPPPYPPKGNSVEISKAAKITQKLRIAGLMITALQGYFTPGLASKLTGVPVSTIQYAAQEGRLISYPACSVIYQEGITKPSGGMNIKLIPSSELQTFIQNYRPKYQR